MREWIETFSSLFVWSVFQKWVYLHKNVLETGKGDGQKSMFTFLKTFFWREQGLTRREEYYVKYMFFLGSNSGNDDWSISINGSASVSKKPLFGSNSLRKTSHHKSDFDGPRMAKQLRHSTKLKIGDATDDIHVCIMCLRAIMNNKFGFNMVIAHEQAINCIALSLVRLLF